MNPFFSYHIISVIPQLSYCVDRGCTCCIPFTPKHQIPCTSTTMCTYTGPILVSFLPPTPDKNLTHPFCAHPFCAHPSHASTRKYQQRSHAGFLVCVLPLHRVSTLPLQCYYPTPLLDPPHCGAVTPPLHHPTPHYKYPDSTVNQHKS